MVSYTIKHAYQQIHLCNTCHLDTYMQASSANKLAEVSRKTLSLSQSTNSWTSRQWCKLHLNKLTSTALYGAVARRAQQGYTHGLPVYVQNAEDMIM